MIVAQLYGYELFPSTLANVVVIDNSALVSASAGVVVLMELFSLPYLLGMYISKLLRWISAGLAFISGFFWLFVTFTNAHAQNSGLFSDTFVVTGGIFAALWSTVLLFIVGWVIAADSNFRHAST